MKPNYCSACGSANIVKKIPKGDLKPRFVCESCSLIHYQNPKIIVGCLATWNDKILLCRRAIEPRIGYWNLPCGFMENSETVTEGALRETREEANAKAEIISLQTIYSIPHIDQVYLIFLARLLTNGISPGEETSEVGLFSRDNLPSDEIAFTSNEFAINNYFLDLKEGDYKVHLAM